MLILTNFGRDYHGAKEFFSILTQAVAGAAAGLQYQTVYFTTDYLSSNLFMINTQTAEITYTNSTINKGRWGTGLDKDNIVDKTLTNVDTLAPR